MLPTYHQLLQIESTSKKLSKTIKIENILGSWRLQRQWPKGKGNKNTISSIFLKLVFATLVLRKTDDKQEEIDIKNYVYIGPVKVEFTGRANYMSDKSFLFFSFRELSILLNNNKILSKELHSSKVENRPFFYFIEIDSHYKSLAARGKGGGLAIWTRS